MEAQSGMVCAAGIVDVDVMMVMEIERRCVVVVDVRTIRVCVVHVRQSSMKRLI